MSVQTPYVYISGALSDLTEERRQELRQFYERLASACEAAGFGAYLPHKVSDPVLAAKFAPAEVDELDRNAVTRARLVIAYVGEPSTGVGIEVEMAREAGIAVILLYERVKLEQRRISRLVRGNPAVREEIAFIDFEHAQDELARILPKYRAAA